MFSLPSLAPQDSYSIWYTSSTSSNPQYRENTNPNDHHATTHGQHATSHTNRRHPNNQRTPLARLRLDEEYIERRKLNIQNYGNSWLKPPGVPKTLSQQREEKREMEEHQEALRREALAQELAEAEAAEGVDELLQGEGMDGEMEEVRDLDDDVPDADNTIDEMEESEEEADNDTNSVANEVADMDESYDANEDDIRTRGIAAVTPTSLIAHAQEAVARLPARLPDDVYREALARGEDAGAVGFGDDGASNLDEEDQAHLLQEEDLVHEVHVEEDMHGMDLDADLDADIPDAEEGGYEHTDTEEELSSSLDEESEDEGHALHRRRTATTSMIRSDGTQTSLDISSMISTASSQIGSSPHPQHASGRRRH